MKKILRYLLMTILLPITIPFLMLVYSGLGISLVFVLFSLAWPLGYLGEDKEWMQTCRHMFILGTWFLWAPFVVVYKYCEYGTFNLD